MTRQQYMEALLPAARQNIIHFVGAEKERRALAMLEAKTTSELAKMYSEQVASGSIKPIQPDAPTVTWQDVENAKQEFQRDLEDLRLRLQAERAADLTLAARSRWLENAPQREAQQVKRLKTAKALFPLVCRAHNLSECEANFRVLFDADMLDSEYTAAQGIMSGAVTLVAASPDEVAMYQQEQIERHNEGLLNSNPLELRGRVNAEATQRRLDQARQADEAAREAEAKKDQRIGFPELPRVTADGTPLDSAWLKRCSNTDISKFRNLIRKHGPSQITNRLRGI